MAVENVNNSGNNTGLYALGAGAAAGVGAGAYGYNSKPYLKDNNYSDTFVKKVESQIVDKFLSGEEKGYYETSLKIAEEINNTKNADELKNVFKNNSEFFDKFAADLNITANDLVDEVDKNGFELTKKSFQEQLKPVISEKDEMVKSALDSCFDESKKLKFDENKITKEGFEVVKKAVKDMNMKAAGIWGGATAAVVGLGTYLLTNNNKKA